MKTFFPLIALSGALALAGCGEPLDGSDTADMTNDAVTADTSEGDTGYNPEDDGMLQTDAAELEDNPDMVKPENAPDMDADDGDM